MCSVPNFPCTSRAGIFTKHFVKTLTTHGAYDIAVVLRIVLKSVLEATAMQQRPWLNEALYTSFALGAPGKGGHLKDEI